MIRRWQRFRADTRGAILVIWAISLVVVLGVLALSFDIGRLASTHAELQSFADQVALAAAGELDGKDDAITRATAAAAALVSRSQTFGSGSHTQAGAADYAMAFYASLPSSDTAALGTPTTIPAKAQYVRVTANQRAVDLTVGRALYGLLGGPVPTPLTGAVAVAGFTQYACDVTPMMFCLPPPGAGETTYRAENHIGSTILLRSGGNGAAWGPGDFGFLDPAGSGIVADPNGPCAGLSPSGVKYYECLMAAEGNISQCFSQHGVNTEPGQKNGIENAIFNLRFDIYTSSMNGKANDPNYPPAPNVIKGLVPKSNGNGKGGGNACIGNTPQTSPDTVPLPIDDCMASGTCGRYGNGTWSTGRTSYVASNYNGSDPHGSAATRFDYYKAEIAAAGGAASKTAILTGKSETGRPQCSPNQSIYPERRVIVVAGIDCTANPINGNATGVPVTEFFKMFLLQPVSTNAASPPSLDIYAEIVGTAQGYGGAGGTGGLFHDVVQLYR